MYLLVCMSSLSCATLWFWENRITHNHNSCVVRSDNFLWAVIYTWENISIIKTIPISTFCLLYIRYHIRIIYLYVNLYLKFKGVTLWKRLPSYIKYASDVAHSKCLCKKWFFKWSLVGDFKYMYASETCCRTHLFGLSSRIRFNSSTMIYAFYHI